MGRPQAWVKLVISEKKDPPLRYGNGSDNEAHSCFQ
jgi:hypothetical protein